MPSMESSVSPAPDAMDADEIGAKNVSEDLAAVNNSLEPGKKELNEGTPICSVVQASREVKDGGVKVKEDELEKNKEGEGLKDEKTEGSTAENSSDDQGEQDPPPQGWSLDDVVGEGPDFRTYYRRAVHHGEVEGESMRLVIRQPGLEQKVMVRRGFDDAYDVGGLCAIFETPEAERQIELKKFFLSDEVPEINGIQGRRPYHGAAQLIPSTETMVTNLSAVRMTCVVEPYNRFQLRNKFPEGVFYVSGHEHLERQDGAWVLLPKDIPKFSSPAQLEISRLEAQEKERERLKRLKEREQRDKKAPQITIKPVLRMERGTRRTRRLRASLNRLQNTEIELDDEENDGAEPATVEKTIPKVAVRIRGKKVEPPPPPTSEPSSSSESEEETSTRRSSRIPKMRTRKQTKLKKIINEYSQLSDKQARRSFIGSKIATGESDSEEGDDIDKLFEDDEEDDITFQPISKQNADMAQKRFFGSSQEKDESKKVLVKIPSRVVQKDDDDVYMPELHTSTARSPDKTPKRAREQAARRHYKSQKKIHSPEKRQAKRRRTTGGVAKSHISKMIRGGLGPGSRRDEYDPDMDGFVVDSEESEEVSEEEPARPLIGMDDDDDDTHAPVNWKALRFEDAFKVYIQYLLSALLDEDFEGLIVSDKREAYFSPARRRVEDHLSTKKNVIIRSSVWTQEFQDELESRPEFRSWSRKLITVNCEACGRGSHPASHHVSLEGPRYNATELWRGTLEAMPETSDIDFEDLSSVSSQKHEDDEEEAADATVYRLGRNCHQRAHLFHRFHHFKFNLVRQLRTKLRQMDSDRLEPQEVVSNILDDVSWVGGVLDSTKVLVEEADEFGAATMKRGRRG